MRIDKKLRNDKRQIRIRKRIWGTEFKPRLSVKFSDRHIYAQCVNDDAGVTLFFLSTAAKDAHMSSSSPNVANAAEFGRKFGQMAAAAGLKEVVFDRNGRKYHGCVKAFADTVREAGLLF